MLKLTNLNQFYGQSHTLWDISLEVQKGECLCVMGRNVEENLKIGIGARRDGLKAVPKAIYDMFPVLYDMRHRQGGDLSGGQQQQLVIGRALVIDPKLIIFDEPTEGIQPNIVSEIAEIMRRLNKEIGLTVLLVEQKLPFARKMGDRFYIIDRGTHVADGQMSSLGEDLIKRYLTV